MIRSFLINKYLAKEFIKIVINTSIIFFCLGFIMNIFEEIIFLKISMLLLPLPLFYRCYLPQVYSITFFHL